MGNAMQPGISTHPRLHATSGLFEELKKKAAGTHSFYYGKLIEAADEFLARGRPNIKSVGDDNRAFGNVLPVLAMAHLVSGEERYLASVRSVVSQLAAFDDWGDNVDLVAGHFLSGAAIAYDWLYDRWTDDERSELKAKIAHHADIIYTYSKEQRVWWHDYFLHNWAHVITGSLAYAAAALYGEDDRAGTWIEHADAFFTEVEKALPEDGSYQEGMAYMTYAWECILRYFDLAGGLYGRDHFGAEWLKTVPYNILYFTTPSPRLHDNCMLFGDGPRHFEWHGPAHLLFRSAREYGDGVIQNFAKYLVSRGVGVTRTGTWLNMLWYDPSTPETDFRQLPTCKHLPNLDTVSMRSGWDEDAPLLAVKCTNNAGRKTVLNYPGRDLGSGHAHPDAASFQLYAFGEWLAVDPGYTHYKESANHNTMLVNNTQQFGGERTWFDMMECFGAAGPCEITDVSSTDEYDYARCDASGIYRPQARLARFIRHVVFVKPGDFVIVDELEGEVKSKFEWRLHADDEISGGGREFHIRKNDARARVLFLAPEDLKTSVRKWRVYGAREHGLRTALLSAEPAARTRKTTFITVLSPYRGDAAVTEVRLVELTDGEVGIDLIREGRARRVSLDLAKAAVRFD